MNALKEAGPEGVPIPRRIAFINEKGGSGKTTLVSNVAVYLAWRRGRRVLAIDMDPQGQLGKVLGLEVRRPRRSAIELLVDSVLGEGPRPESLDAPPEPGLPIVATRFPNLDAIVSNKSLALFPSWTGAGAEESDPTGRLARSLTETPGALDYDFVLIDAPPSFGPLTLNILRAANELVVPVPLTYLAMDGCAELMRSVDMVRQRYGNEDLRLTMVIPTFYRRTRLANEILEKLKQRFPKEIAHTVVGFHVRIDEAQSRGQSVFEHAPSDRGAKVMAALAEELEARGRPEFGAAP
ncbi:MAG: ParA family protein [Proteobacteria bacterium]|nr:ParA family protein [Pseudomonadota bacterium]MCZ6782614.1 ParA family protein [Pseudomonadota bacterium]